MRSCCTSSFFLFIVARKTWKEHGECENICIHRYVMYMYLAFFFSCSCVVLRRNAFSALYHPPCFLFLTWTRILKSSVCLCSYGLEPIYMMVLNVSMYCVYITLSHNKTVGRLIIIPWDQLVRWEPLHVNSSGRPSFPPAYGKQVEVRLIVTYI